MSGFGNPDGLSGHRGGDPLSAVTFEDVDPPHLDRVSVLEREDPDLLLLDKGDDSPVGAVPSGL